MRVTNSTLLRNYERNLNRLATHKFGSEKKIYSGRKFARASESPLSASKALTIRKQLSHTKQYMENLDVADKFYTEAETSLLQISEKLATVRETLIYACNTPLEKEVDVNILAQQLETHAREMVSVFNTDSAERAIFGGESNSPEPFTLEIGEDNFATQILYHGVPVNAYSDYNDFPYSKDIYIDIGIGIVVDQTTQEIDPQSALKVSFNGASISGCGAAKYDASIDLNSLKKQEEYTIDLYMAGEPTTITFRAGATPEETADILNEKLTEAYQYRGVPIPKIEMQNESIDMNSLVGNKEYSLDIDVAGEKRTITFTAGNTPSENKVIINDALKAAFDGSGVTVPEFNLDIEEDIGTFSAGDDTINVEVSPASANAPVIRTTGNIVAGNETDGFENIYIAVNPKSANKPVVDNNYGFSNNYLQITLDAANALKNGDLEYANACIDKIVTSTSHLLMEIADLGNSEEFISFNKERFETRELNLKDRQDTLEATDLETEITAYKTYEALYNACLQMSSAIIPNTIFNYIN